MVDAALKLLTLINVSAARPGKRQRLTHRVHYKKISSKVADAADAAASDPSSSRSSKKVKKSSSETRGQGSFSSGLVGEEDPDSDVEIGSSSSNNKSASDKDNTNHTSAFDVHFGSEGNHGKAIAQMGEGDKIELSWSHSKRTLAPIGDVLVSSPQLEGLQDTNELQGNPQLKVLEAFEKYAAKKYDGKITPLHKTLINKLGSYTDLVHSHVSLSERRQIREALAMHAMSHVAKTRRRVVKNNEKLAKLASSAADGGGGSSSAAAVDATSDVQDQGFTRPKVLILLPLRNSALEWVQLLSDFSLCSQVDNKSRFQKEYTLPEGTVDRLADPSARDKYSLEHIETFKGNIDDNFKLGLKVTRKSFKLFTQFYESDVIIASPLGLRLAMENESNFDFLSSIEILIADQMDVMSMQNWEHVQFVLDRLNQIPKQAHDTDFSRVKQWYLDNRASHFRQSIFLSSYDFSHLRNLYSSYLHNVAGKHRTLHQHDTGSLVQVKSGLRQTFTRFDCSNLHSEPDLRFLHFTAKLLPQLLKSAVSSCQTIVFIPDYFDFVRLDDFFRSRPEISYTSISEYSTNSEINRARTTFYNGRHSFLLITERFHFYRRYKIRGAKTIVFYQLPNHSEYFSEVLEFPFVKGQSSSQLTLGHGDEEQEEEAEIEEISTQVVYSKYDLMQLERIVGTEQAQRMVTEEKAVWRFM